MKGFIWNIESAAQFKDVVKEDYSKIRYVDKKVNEHFGVEVEYLTDIEKTRQQMRLKKVELIYIKMMYLIILITTEPVVIGV